MNMDIMLDPEYYGYKVCEHCNGYGSSLKEESEKCTKCGGSGLVKKEKEKKMTGKDVKDLSKYLFNVELDDFARDIYGKDEADYYVKDAFNKMHNTLIVWLGTLDEICLERLVVAINRKGAE